MRNKMIMSEDEKMAQNILGNEVNIFNLSENKIEDIIDNEKSRKFNDQVEEYTTRLENHSKELNSSIEEMGKNIDLVEIKPMFNRILVKPFKQNPFQKLTITKNGLISDLGGMAPDFTNPDTGKVEQMEQAIITGAVQEIGPDVKYLIPGDVVMYRKETAMPVPFYKQGFWCLAESQIIAVVNEGLEKRFEEVKQLN